MSRLNNERGVRLTRLLDLVGTMGGEGEMAHLCGVCASVSNVSGAGITLMTARASVGVGGTDDLTGVLEDLQFTPGEGPGVDAYCQDQPVLEPDLAHPLEARWPAFSSHAVTAGARAVFSFPLSLDTVHLGTPRSKTAPDGVGSGDPMGRHGAPHENWRG